MTRFTIASRHRRHLDTPTPPGARSAEELGRERPGARLTERVILEYARAWRRPRAQAEDRLASGAC